MAEPIQCPRCGEDFELSEALSREARNELRAEVAEQYAAREADLEKREARAKAEFEKRQANAKAALRKEKEALERALDEERKRVAEHEKARAKESVSAELEGLREELTETKSRFTETKKAHLELLKQRNQLEQERADMELTVETRVGEQLKQLREQESQRVGERYERKLEEATEREAQYKRRIAELQRHAEQGSQQVQGEALEASLEAMLTGAFPHDLIEPVPKGTRGADLIHRVVDRSGAVCGTIVWEFKRTKNWNAQWLTKLRDDQRALKADVPALVSDVLPEGVDTLGEIDGVWVATVRCALGLAAVLRDSIFKLTSSKKALEGRQGKMDLLYAYMSGPEFLQRMQGLVEPFIAMQSAVSQERRAMEKIWKAREAQINRAILSMAGLKGDVEGIAGLHLAAIDELELPDQDDAGESQARRHRTRTGVPRDGSRLGPANDDDCDR